MVLKQRQFAIAQLLQVNAISNERAAAELTTWGIEEDNIKRMVTPRGWE
ncbi:MAG TPA: hypothetical protein VEJ87_08145 [Acidimicrobiales bacterium]|nr:hypothetical protein [Acidimicrobiales bacterium]